MNSLSSPSSIRPLIASSTGASNLAAWQSELASASISCQELFDTLKIDPRHRAQLLDEHKALAQFPLRVTRSFIQRMRPGDINDPLLRQVLPTHDENSLVMGFSTDPVGDIAANAVPGIVHKYHGRALLITTKACAIHCRYCFRRHFPYQDNRLNESQRDAAIQYIANDTSITEIILSGGDPLASSDKYLHQLVSQLAQIPHLKTLRIHSRLPVVLPSRVGAAMFEWLALWRKRKVLVIHSNHANELDGEVANAIQALKDHPITVLNQSVLLRGINDDVDTLVQLSERLFDIGVMPYYLHALDRVSGAQHFEVDDALSKALIRKVSARLPGYLVPKFVREIGGAQAKTLI